MDDIQRVDKALLYLDKLFPIIPDFANFNVSDLMLKSGWKPEDVEDGYDLDGIIQILLVDRLKYASGKDDAYWIKLNDLGRQVKSKGGHFPYLKFLDEKAKIETERQDRKDKAEKLDLQLKTWQVRTKYLPYIVSILALGVSIASYFKPEKKQTDLQPMQQEIKLLRQSVQRLDTLYRLDSLLKTDSLHIQ